MLQNFILVFLLCVVDNRHTHINKYATVSHFGHVFTLLQIFALVFGFTLDPRAMAMLENGCLEGTLRQCTLSESCDLPLDGGTEGMLPITYNSNWIPVLVGSSGRWSWRWRQIKHADQRRSSSGCFGWSGFAELQQPPLERLQQDRSLACV